MNHNIPLLFAASLGSLYSSNALACAQDRGCLGVDSEYCHSLQTTGAFFKDEGETEGLYELMYGGSFTLGSKEADGHHGPSLSILPSVTTRNVHGEWVALEDHARSKVNGKALGLSTVGALVQSSFEHESEEFGIHGYLWVGPSAFVGHYTSNSTEYFGNDLESFDTEFGVSRQHVQARLQQGGMMTVHSETSGLSLSAGFDSSVPLAGKEVGELGYMPTASVFGSARSSFGEHLFLGTSYARESFVDSSTQGFSFHDSRFQGRIGFQFVQDGADNEENRYSVSVGLGKRNHQELLLGNTAEKKDAEQRGEIESGIYASLLFTAELGLGHEEDSH